eukprot:2235685-Amphidinium_carterae.2
MWSVFALTNRIQFFVCGLDYIALKVHLVGSTSVLEPVPFWIAIMTAGVFREWHRRYKVTMWSSYLRTLHRGSDRTAVAVLVLRQIDSSQRQKQHHARWHLSTVAT